jgi:hypothetical protein
MALPMSVTPDVLTAGTERGRVGGRFRRWARTHRLLVGCLLAALVVMAALDQWQRQREMESLLRSVTVGEQSISSADGSLGVVVNYYSPLIFRTDASEQMRAGFQSDLSAAAAAGAVATSSAVATVSDVRILPWHRALVDARDAYVARMVAWNTYLKEVQTTPYDRFGAANDTLPSTIDAKGALLRATPWPWVNHDSSRIEDLLAP